MPQRVMQTASLDLERAILTFWRKGYDGTSLKDLLKAMQILNGSFYHKYGSKKNVFLQALDAYEREFVFLREGLFRSPHSFSKKIRLMFFSIIERPAQDLPKGCLLFNSVSLDAIQDEEVRKKLVKMIEEFESFLEQQLDQARDKEGLQLKQDSAELAQVLVCYMQGMMKQLLLHDDEKKHRSQIECLFQALGF